MLICSNLYLNHVREHFSSVFYEYITWLPFSFPRFLCFSCLLLLRMAMDAWISSLSPFCTFPIYSGFSNTSFRFRWITLASIWIGAYSMMLIYSLFVLHSFTCIFLLYAFHSFSIFSTVHLFELQHVIALSCCTSYMCHVSSYFYIIF